jgi:hypothetical protein
MHFCCASKMKPYVHVTHLVDCLQMSEI